MQGTFCNQHSYECFLTDVQAACCDENGRNCPDGQDIPLTCPVGCAVVFPAFLETCRAHVREQAGLQEEDYESFETLCLSQDGLALVEYAIVMQENGCVLDLSSEHGRRQLQAGLFSQGVAGSSECPWDEFDNIADDVDRHESPLHASPPPPIPPRLNGWGLSWQPS